SLDKLVSKQKISEEESHKIFSRITTEVDLGRALKNCDLMIEAVPEVMDLKKKVYAEVDMVANKNTIYASNTSTLPITEIANITSRPEKFIGIHFFNPPQLMKLVEVIPGQKTAKETVDVTMSFVKSVSKEPVLCKKDVVGFIVNRIFIPLVHEAVWMMDRTKASMIEIDSAVKFVLHFPMGIFELADFTGLDVIHKATIEMYSRDKKVINPHPLIQKLFDQKKFGQKTGSGFYEYAGEKYERINLTEELAKKIEPTPIIGTMLNNAAWLVTNQASDTVEIEKALNLGMGLRKPIFETAKEFGMAKIVQELQTLSRKYGQFYEPDPYLLSIQN
ncbi:MAG: 3-hydroxyacyl-CoA dehydrogenase family protein, partial [Thaumarchaeota archaeon]|nr:3-hydroxyacyl-CoA dehydrogenase family protein [Nitrososphaerota archaeon]